MPRGARVRPRLCHSVAAACGEDHPAATEAAGAALELLHCASLVHDDLPCFDAAETPLFHLNRELEKDFPELVFHPEIGNITRPDTLRRVMQRYRPAVLYHAAAYKHVPMMEKHVFAAVENNIFGTWHVALAAVESGVEDFVSRALLDPLLAHAHPRRMRGLTTERQRLAKSRVVRKSLVPR